MQENHLSQLTRDALKSMMKGKGPLIQEEVKPNMKAFAEQIKKDLPDLPDYMRTPTEEELTDMRQYAIDYKKQFPKASQRKIRKAIQEKWNIRIYK